MRLGCFVGDKYNINLTITITIMISSQNEMRVTKHIYI